MEVIWSVLTILLSTSKNFADLVIIRFFVGKIFDCRMYLTEQFVCCRILGLAESTFYPAMQYVIGSWYKPVRALALSIQALVPCTGHGNVNLKISLSRFKDCSCACKLAV